MAMRNVDLAQRLGNTDQSQPIMDISEDIQGHFQRTFKEHLRNMQNTFREHSGNIQGHLNPFVDSPFGECVGRVSACGRSGGLFVPQFDGPVQLARHISEEHSGNIQGTFRQH
jgi:hypothetical protein